MPLLLELIYLTPFQGQLNEIFCLNLFLPFSYFLHCKINNNKVVKFTSVLKKKQHLKTLQGCRYELIGIFLGNLPQILNQQTQLPDADTVQGNGITSEFFRKSSINDFQQMLICYFSYGASDSFIFLHQVSRQNPKQPMYEEILMINIFQLLHFYTLYMNKKAECSTRHTPIFYQHIKLHYCITISIISTASIYSQTK